MPTFQYIDYPGGQSKTGLERNARLVAGKRWQSMNFWRVVYLVLLIPVVNILMMPAAVAGATLFWVRERGVDTLKAMHEGP